MAGYLDALRTIASADPLTPADALRLIASEALQGDREYPDAPHPAQAPEAWCECYRHGYDPRFKPGLPCMQGEDHARRLNAQGAPRAEDLESIR